MEGLTNFATSKSAKTMHQLKLRSKQHRLTHKAYKAQAVRLTALKAKHDDILKKHLMGNDMESADPKLVAVIREEFEQAENRTLNAEYDLQRELNQKTYVRDIILGIVDALTSIFAQECNSGL